MTLTNKLHAVPHAHDLPVRLDHDSAWLGPALTLAARHTELWITDEAHLAPFASALEASLQSDERARAQRLVRAEDGRRFMLFRGALRCLLARYLGARPPDSLIFSYGARGKPALLHPNPIQFNLSHSGNRMALAVSHQPVGVDIERLDRASEMEALAARFFHPEETACLARIPAEKRRALFFRWWTAKEAALKAWGVGLGSAGDQPDFSLWPTETTARFVAASSARTGLIRAFPDSPEWAGAWVTDLTVKSLTVRDATGWWWARP